MLTSGGVGKLAYKTDVVYFLCYIVFPPAVILYGKHTRGKQDCPFLDLTPCERPRFEQLQTMDNRKWPISFGVTGE
jgi:hypothetical protein